MAVKINDQDKSESQKYVPQFDFGTSNDSGKKQLATLADLLMELNHEFSKAPGKLEDKDNGTKSNGNLGSQNKIKAGIDGTEHGIKSLITVRRFINSITGRQLNSTIEQHSISDIKTIKSLFYANRDTDSQLTRIMEPPGSGSESILDIITSEPTPESQKALITINSIIEKLAKEIDDKELSEIDDVCSQEYFRETHHKKTNHSVDEVILHHINVNDDFIKHADRYLADKTREFHNSITPIKRESRIHVATYTYLKVLDYVHRLHFDISTQLTIPNDRGISNKQINFDWICKDLSDKQGKEIFKDTNFMDIHDVSQFIESYAPEIAKLVSSCTGFKYNKRDVLKDKNRAIVIEVIYLAITDLPNDKNMKPIGVVHVVAAFCSILHQRKKKTKLGRKSRKYSSKLSTPQNKLDAYISNYKNGLHLTAQYIYTERMYWYISALTGRKDKDDSSLTFNIAQSELYKEIYMSLDHKQIKSNLNDYRNFMIDSANKFIEMHNRQDTVYEWTYGG